MKSHLMVASAAGLLVMTGLAYSQGMPETQSPAPQESTATQAAPSSTATQSYGGMPDTKIQSGAKQMKPCGNDPQCNIFFGGS
ncbi:hypothetical protein R69927_05637 [Paraburkholderia domus]|uniref:Uncharacterized protein n=1 Tax=Paraburkholderia domus TaxID=2793075 RepID=A0A9N8R6C8_9BURK|nr:hypothetical protein [Paraburkholderia domus]MBK5065427.1 hypothetical protein [Burkholderia sp. R-70199]MBK5089886.1 hypothetical protein [Burkholderia sp. R-69927]MBK5124811.1 hypothetical protein [Burkholderia sp. R-69980]MBK5169847.1 hypothetical protein [Burkholderia sp. R-70211]MBK5179362.1 hypothetical protein [Burkholderia sp. R-69749]MCI0151185.1 hypothetical protein [Paraburkholderia sediminicola]